MRERESSGSGRAGKGEVQFTYWVGNAFTALLPTATPRNPPEPILPTLYRPSPPFSASMLGHPRLCQPVQGESIC